MTAGQYWRCPKCGAQMTTCLPAISVAHPCPKNRRWQTTLLPVLQSVSNTGTTTNRRGVAAR